MKYCSACELPYHNCICSQVDDFFEENNYLMEDLRELEAQNKKKKRCDACYFFECKCASGHAKRLRKL